MRFKVVYQKPKKKGCAKQEAVFFDVRDAILWEKHVKTQGCFDVETHAIG